MLTRSRASGGVGAPGDSVGGGGRGSGGGGGGGGGADADSAAAPYVPRTEDFPADYPIDANFDSDVNGRPAGYVFGGDDADNELGVVTRWTEEEKAAARELLRQSQEALQRSGGARRGAGADIMGSGGEVDAALNELSPQLRESIRRVEEGQSAAVDRFRREAARMGVDIEALEAEARAEAAALDALDGAGVTGAAEAPPPGARPLTGGAGADSLYLGAEPKRKLESTGPRPDSLAAVHARYRLATRTHRGEGGHDFDRALEAAAEGGSRPATLTTPALPSKLPATLRVLVATAATVGVGVAALVFAARGMQSRVAARPAARQRRRGTTRAKEDDALGAPRPASARSDKAAASLPQVFAAMSSALRRADVVARLLAFAALMVGVKCVLPWAYKAPLEQAALAALVILACWRVVSEWRAVATGAAFGRSFPSLGGARALLADAEATFDASGALGLEDLPAAHARARGRMYLTRSALALYGFFGKPAIELKLADIARIETMPGSEASVRLTLAPAAGAGSVLLTCREGTAPLAALVRAVEDGVAVPTQGEDGWTRTANGRLVHARRKLSFDVSCNMFLDKGTGEWSYVEPIGATVEPEATRNVDPTEASMGEASDDTVRGAAP